MVATSCSGDKSEVTLPLQAAALLSGAFLLLGLVLLVTVKRANLCLFLDSPLETQYSLKQLYLRVKHV